MENIEKRVKELETQNALLAETSVWCKESMQKTLLTFLDIQKALIETHKNICILNTMIDKVLREKYTDSEIQELIKTAHRIARSEFQAIELNRMFEL